MNQDIRAPYYGELGRLSFSPGWARPEPAMWPAPRPKFKPAVWRFAAAKAALDQAGEFVPVEQAERRNLIMVNPIEGNVYATSRNIVAAYQMVKAGEKARSHRHTAAALRLVVEAKPGTYTVVDGARVDMAPGDVVLTPSWSWHGHANESDATSYWIDFLDVPFVQHSEAMFFEANPAGFETITSNGPSAAPHPFARCIGAGNRREDGGDRQGRAADDRPAPDAAAFGHAQRGRQDHGQSPLLRHQRQGAGDDRGRSGRDARGRRRDDGAVLARARARSRRGCGSVAGDR